MEREFKTYFFIHHDDPMQEISVQDGELKNFKNLLSVIIIMYILSDILYILS